MKRLICWLFGHRLLEPTKLTVQEYMLTRTATWWRHCGFCGRGVYVAVKLGESDGNATRLKAEREAENALDDTARPWPARKGWIP